MNENPMGGEPQATEGAQAPAASAPVETPAAAPSGDAAPAADWRVSLPEGWADKLKDVESADDAMAALERGLAYRDDSRLKPTKQGWLCGNELYGALLDLAP